VRPNDLFQIFFVAWIALGVCLWLFYKRASYRRKRQWHLFVVAGTGFVFICFAYVMFPRPEVLYMAVPAVALIAFLNYRLTRFCPNCGLTIPPRALGSRAAFCPRCGANLDDMAHP
jgi:ribosomal protein S27AE